jgi:hypothetical protein
MKSIYILVILISLGIGSYFSYLVTFRLFDSDGDGSITKEEIEAGYNKILDPDINHKKNLEIEIIRLKNKVKSLEEQLQKLQNSCSANTKNLLTIIENDADAVVSKGKSNRKPNNFLDKASSALMIGQEAVLNPPDLISKKSQRKSKKNPKKSNR